MAVPDAPAHSVRATSRWCAGPAAPCSPVPDGSWARLADPGSLAALAGTSAAPPAGWRSRRTRPPSWAAPAAATAGWGSSPAPPRTWQPSGPRLRGGRPSGPPWRASRWAVRGGGARGRPARRPLQPPRALATGGGRALVGLPAARGGAAGLLGRGGPGALTVLSGSGGPARPESVAGPGRPWVALPAVPAGTATLSPVADGSVDAFAVDGSGLRIFRLPRGHLLAARPVDVRPPLVRLLGLSGRGYGGPADPPPGEGRPSRDVPCPIWSTTGASIRSLSSWRRSWCSTRSAWPGCGPARWPSPDPPAAAPVAPLLRRPGPAAGRRRCRPSTTGPVATSSCT